MRYPLRKSSESPHRAAGHSGVAVATAESRPERALAPSAAAEATPAVGTAVAQLPDEWKACVGCGVALQCEFPGQRGFVPPHRVEEFQKSLQRGAEIDEASLYTPVLDWDKELFQLEKEHSSVPDLDFENSVIAKPLSKKKKKELKVEKRLTCERCHRLHHQGYLMGNPDSQKPEDVSRLVTQRLGDDNRTALALLVIDVFDVQGSLVPAVSRLISRKTPLILAANKYDLLPKDASEARIKNWLRKEAAKVGLEPRGIFPISAKRGINVVTMIAYARSIAAAINYERREERRNQMDILKRLRSSTRRMLDSKPELVDESGVSPVAENVPNIQDIYVIGTTNVGKSTLINMLIKRGMLKARRAQLVTESIVPGTTLDVISFPMRYDEEEAERKTGAPMRLNLLDTPGILNPDQLTQHLNLDELKSVIPSSDVRPQTFHIEMGQSMLLGAFARIDLVEGRAFQFTVFASNLVTIHITKRERVPDLLQSHVGGLLAPPFSAARHATIGVSDVGHPVRVKGQGWKKSAIDIVFPGLGWVAITGAGECHIEAFGSRAVDPAAAVVTREPLLPFEARTSGVRFTGGRKQWRPNPEVERAEKVAKRAAKAVRLADRLLAKARAKKSKASDAVATEPRSDAGDATMRG